MPKSISTTCLFCIALMFSVSSAGAQDWNQWRGPTGNGGSADANPPTKWSHTENVKWKVAIPGRGSGSPVISGNKVFVVSAVLTEQGAKDAEAQKKAQAQNQGQDGQQGRRGGRRGRRRGPAIPMVEMDFKLFCFDRSSGDKIWEKTATTATPHQGTHSTNGFASASPCTDGQHVYASFGSRGLYCYSIDGDFVWKRDDLGQMETRNSFGEGSSPTLYEDKLIVPWDHEGPSSIYALNKLNGKTIWKTDRDEPTNWGTPIVVNNGDQKQVVITGQTKVRAYDFESGDEIWSCGGQTERPCATAVAIDDLVIVGSGHRGSFMGAFKLDGTGDIAGSDKVVWSINQNTPDIASPLLSNGRLYFHKGKTGILTCLDAKTGDSIFPATRVPEIKSTYASPVAAGGNIYLTGRSGNTVVIKDSDKFEVVASNSVGETVDATPAPAGDNLFIRGEKHLFCIGK